MHITGMTIQGIPPFTERVDMEFDEQVNVFIGPNASGKSKALACLSGWSVDTYLADGEREVLEIHVSDDGLELPDYNVPKPHDRKLGSIPFVYIPAARMALPNLSTVSDDERDLLQWRRVESWFHVLTEREDPQIFDPRTVYQAMYMIDEGLHRDEFGHGFEGEISRYRGIVKLMSICNNCVTQICDIVENEHLSHYQDTVYFTNSIIESPIVHPGMGIYTSDPPRYSRGHPPIFLGELSSGTQGTSLWIMYLAVKIAQFYDFVGDWDTKPAILFIDEIENHLHPTWQRRVIPALLEYFPGLQIFATTHSPFVVAGLKAGQVHMLKRDENGLVTASTNTEDIVGWTSDEILRNLMGVADPTDEATAAAARELRRLRDEGPRDTEDAEAARQERMQELRRLVDRDLLAGGPMAARRELFEQQFAEALEKYQRSRDLGQDSG